MRLLFDTNVVSAAARPHLDTSIVERVRAAQERAAIAAVTWHELRHGVELMPEGRRRDDLAAFLRGMVGRLPVLPYDERAADWHAVERARLGRLGRTRPYADGQIAAVAATNDLTLVTRNLTDFDGYRDLRVESWWSGA